MSERWPGITLGDLVDRPYHDWFEVDDMTPEQALAEVAEEQGEELDERQAA